MGVLAGVSFVDAECNFRIERTFGKAEVLDVKRFNVTRRNKCFPDRGSKLGKIVFRFEPEGTSNFIEYIGYFDAMTQCFDTNDQPMSCSLLPLGSEIRNVEFIERRRPAQHYRGRGILKRLFLVP
jgi:hypothetical protein